MTKTITIILLAIGSITGLHAQQAVTATGGDASGSGGSTSYTVGQIAYTIHQGTNGNSIVQGVQQPYEISVATGIAEAMGITIELSAYPNPANEYLIVKVENYKTDNLRYLIFSMDGKLLSTKKADGPETQIATGNLAPAVYLVKVLDNQKEIKVFKVIKK